VPPSDCPLPHTRSRILDRRETEGGITRHIYTVEVTNIGHWSGDPADTKRTQIVEVDLSVILKFVSPAELERYENEQFKIEAEVEAVARRAEAEEQVTRRLERAARVSGAGRGSRLLSGLGRGDEAPTRGRGKPRGRRGRGTRRTVEATDAVARREEMMEALLRQRDEHLERREESHLEKQPEEEDARAQTSPGLMRSAFVTNSALPVSPTQRRLSTSVTARGQPEVPDTEDGDSNDDMNTGGYDARSMSSAAIQLRSEDNHGGRVIEESKEETRYEHVSSGRVTEESEQEEFDSDAGEEEHQHQAKRRRTESMSMSIVPDSQPMVSIPEDAFKQTPLFPDRSSALDSASSAPHDALPEEAFRQTPLFQDRSSLLQASSESSDESVPLPSPGSRMIADSLVWSSDSSSDMEPHLVQAYNSSRTCVQARAKDDEEAEEYVIEAILDHYKERGVRYYLVKWEGYEDSHDWLSEGDLEGAQDLLEEYKEKIRQEDLLNGLQMRHR
jgi:hypothetical protein